MHWIPRERIRELVEIDANGCWIWQRSLSSYGYGIFRHEKHQVLVHRYAYQIFIGEIPAGLDLDHLCRTRACCNPAHLEPVTRRVNLLRGQTIPAENAAKTHCKRGHEFTPENTRIQKQYGRVSRGCRTCIAEYRRRWRRDRRRRHAPTPPFSTIGN